ncbi:MAG: hypothetical protein KIT45_03710 [Fimbriimonadia bacterium]|nr:hypothetical protein [Fimbriimonadia bacterium]
MKHLFLCIVIALVAMIGTANAQTGGTFNLEWSTIDGGGHTFSTGGGFKLGGTVGQPDAFGANPMHTGGAFSLSGGFWFQRIPGDANADGCVNDNDLLEVLFVFGSSGLFNADVNDDGIVNDNDLLIVLFNFGTGC